MERTRPTRRRVLAGAATTAALLAGCSGGDDRSRESSSSGDGTQTPTRTGTGSRTESGSGTPSRGWRETELTDVLTDETFTIAGLSPPVVLETFAVWCPVCTRQQEQLGELTGGDSSLVSLNTDPNEDAAAVRSHAEEHGFDWRYAVAPAEMTRSLIDEFGPGVTNAPSAPVVVVCGDGSANYLSNRGVEPADRIRAATRDC